MARTTRIASARAWFMAERKLTVGAARRQSNHASRRGAAREPGSGIVHPAAQPLKLFAERGALARELRHRAFQLLRAQAALLGRELVVVPIFRRGELGNRDVC